MAVAPEFDINTGVSFTMVGSTLLVAREIKDVKLPGSSVTIFDSSHQGTTGGKTKIPADLVDNSSFDCVVHHKQDLDAQSEVGLEGEVVITLPHGAVSLVTFDGILQSYEPQNTPLDEPMMADVVIEVSGDLDYTVAV